jgi:twitching motility protein PilT
VPSFHDGLRHALRQSPDVLLIGEMRDAETVNAALDATETGHLVLSTLHTVNAPQTVERILSFYPAEQHREVRLRLADNIAGVLSQRLVPRANERGLVPAYELLQSTPHVRELLGEGKTGELARAIESGVEKGLVSFNQCLRRLVLDGVVGIEDALATSDRPEELVLLLRGISGGGTRTDGRTLAPDPAKPADGLRLARPA